MAFDRSYFERQYRDYERQNPPRKLRFYRRLAERAAAGHPEPRILDYGCAFGLFLGSLGASWRRLGVDASDYAIEKARTRFPGVMFRSCAPGDYPELEPVDVVTAFDVLEHIAALDEFFGWLGRALKAGGAFVFVVPVYDGPTGPVIRFLDRDPTHIHRRPRVFWLEQARGRFRRIEWWGIYRYLLPGACYLHCVTGRLRRYAPAIACVAWRD